MFQPQPFLWLLFLFFSRSFYFKLKGTTEALPACSVQPQCKLKWLHLHTDYATLEQDTWSRLLRGKLQAFLWNHLLPPPPSESMISDQQQLGELNTFETTSCLPVHSWSIKTKPIFNFCRVKVASGELLWPCAESSSVWVVGRNWRSSVLHFCLLSYQ